MCITNFVIGNVINSGSYGTVRKAVDIRTNEIVAIKSLPLKRHDIIETKNTNMINREIDVWTKLSHEKHKNILYLKEYFWDVENVYFVSEYCQKGTLVNIQSNKKFDLLEVKYIIKSILSGILYCHKNDIAHSDIKPANILLSDDNNLKLCDFGHSQRNTSQYKGLLARRGTPVFMAPEIYDDYIEYGNNVDVWAIGILAYMLFFNCHPFIHNYINATFKDIKDMINIKKFKNPLIIDDLFLDFIKHCLEFDKTKRYSCEEAINHPFLNLQCIDFEIDITNNKNEPIYFKTDDGIQYEW
jgi:serine/threonine protein kinase